MVNIIPPDHVDDVPVVEPNQHDDVPVIPEHVLVDDDEDPEEEEFEEEEESQEEEVDMDVDIEEDENESELTYHYEEVDPLNPLPPVFDLEREDVIKVEDPIESEDETVPASVHKVGQTSTAPFLREYSDGLFPGLCGARNENNGKLVEKLGNAEEKAGCEKLKKDLEEARGFVFEERPNEAIDVPVEDQKSPSYELRGSPRDS
ncbi:hypothetical protein Tco_1512853 [Tanacetum coccineum]